MIIPCFNGQDCILEAVNSVVRSSVKADILIVDNASTDTSVSIIKKIDIPVQLVQNRVNEGFGMALNKGFEYGKKHGYSYFLILNQDASLFENSLERMIDFVSSVNETSWFFVSPYNLGSDTKSAEYYFLDNLEKRSGHSASIVLGDHRYKEVQFINAACWLINSRALSVLKGFDRRFFMYGEDLDICNRAFHLGYKMMVLENTFCIHHKAKGDYENHPTKMLALKLGEVMAWYLNPSYSRVSKFKRFLAVTLASLKLAVKGKSREAGEKFRINLIAVLRLIG